MRQSEKKQRSELPGKDGPHHKRGERPVLYSIVDDNIFLTEVERCGGYHKH